MLWGLSLSVAGLMISVCAVRALNWAWWTPRRLERALRAQGLDGTPYRFLHGDLNDNRRLIDKARAKPMALSHDIIRRVAPLLHLAVFYLAGAGANGEHHGSALIRDMLLSSNKLGRLAKQKLNPLHGMLATGLATYEGEQWAKHRRILDPAFHVEKIKRMLPAFSSCCGDMIGRWERYLMSSEGCVELDIWPEIQDLCRDAVSRTLFASNYEEGRRIFELQAEQSELAFEASESVYIPGYKFLPTSSNKRRREIAREVRGLVLNILKNREEAIRTSVADSDGLLGLMIESNIKHRVLTTEEVIEDCKLFYLAGHETTSVLLTWTMVVLSMHPSWQIRARKEVLRVFGSNSPHYDGLNQLKTVSMILHEVLRLYPPGIMMVRRTCKPVKLGSVTYPPGVLLLLPIIFLHHDPEFWGRDVSEFKPEKFGEAYKEDTAAFFPFGGGPRICIGHSFAMVEAKVALCMILQRFSFQLSPAYAHAPHAVLTIQPQYGAHIVIEGRRIS